VFWVSEEKPKDFWQQLAASASAVLTAALPVIVALAPLGLGPLIVFGTPPLVERAGSFFKSLGWIK
jgi:hypothetical protein